MKKIIYCLFALLAFGGTAMAQKVTVADVEAVPGETVSFSVSVSELKADTYTAMTLYVQFPATGFTTTAKKVANIWESSSTLGDVDETGLAIIPIASDVPIPGTEVENLVTVSFTVDESVALGEYDVTLKNTMFEYGTSDKDYAEDVTFKVNVVNAHTVVLDENSTTAPVAAEGVNVRVLRTINANQWSTICLPFAMTEAQVKAAFGSDVQVGDFTGYDTTEDADENIVAITVNFNNVTAMEANHPYIIKVAEAKTEFTVEGVAINPEDEPSVSYSFTTGKGKNTVYHPIDFIGTYVADFNFYEAAKSTPLFLSGNKFFYATESSKPMKAFRAYFDFDDVLASVDESRITMSFGNETTGIAYNRETKVDDRYYNMNGQRISAPKKGLFVKQGKKVVLK